jgi:hypothetical protein
MLRLDEEMREFPKFVSAKWDEALGRLNVPESRFHKRPRANHGEHRETERRLRVS